MSKHILYDPDLDMPVEQAKIDFAQLVKDYAELQEFVEQMVREAEKEEGEK